MTGWINHHRIITDEFRPRKKKAKSARTFPKVHTFKVTVAFTTRMRIADAQRIVRQRLAVHCKFNAGFEVTKVARTRR